MIIARQPDKFSGKHAQGGTDIDGARDVLGSLISGVRLTDDQKRALVSVKADLHNNPAVQKLISTAAQLKGTKLLPAYVDNVVQANLLPMQPPRTTGDPALDQFIGDFAAVRLSPAFGNIATALAPIMQSPAFISFLQRQRPDVLVNFIPVGARVNLLLPNDRDPVISQCQRDLLGILAVFLGAVLTIIFAPEELLTLPVSALILAAELAALLPSIDDAFDACGTGGNLLP